MTVKHKAIVFQRTAWWPDFIKAESSAKIETHKDNRNEIYFVKSDNRKDDILCGCMFILMSHSNEFIMVVNLKSEVK